MSKSFLLVVFISIGQFLSASVVDDVFSQAYSMLNTDMEKSIETVRSFENGINQYSKKEREKFYHQAAHFYATIGDFNQEEDHWSKKIKLLPSNSDTSFRTLYRLAFAQFNGGKFDEALANFRRCEKYYLKHDQRVNLVQAYNGIAMVIASKGDNKGSIAYYFKSIDLLKKEEDDLALSKTYSNLSYVYVALGETKKALEIRRKSYAAAKRSKNEEEIRFVELNLGSSFNAMHKTDSALYYLKRAEAYFEQNFNAQILNGIYNDLGQAYSVSGNNEKAEEYYLKSIDLLRAGGFVFALPGTLSNYGFVLEEKGEFLKGISTCQEAYSIAKGMQFLEVEKIACECLYKNFKGANKSDSALLYLERTELLKDSLSGIEKQKEALQQELERSYSKEKEGIINSANTELSNEISFRNWVLFGFVLLLVIAVGLFFILRQRKKTAQLIQQEKDYLDNLLHNLVHEFRTPLTLIKGPTEELLKKDVENQLLNVINRNSDQMLVLINQVLDFAKIKAGKLNVQEELVNYAVLIADLVGLFEPSAHDKHINLQNENKVNFPHLILDSDKLMKILTNLLSNAIKYSNPNTVIRVESSLRDENLTISVIDQGIGIAKKDQEQVFEKFYQVDSTVTRKGEGTGLGLAFARELAQLLDGKLELTSELGKGTAVSLTIPVRIAAHEDELLKDEISLIIDEEMAVEEELEDTDVSDAKLILIIEDNSELRDFLVLILGNEGYRCEVAVDGEEGVEKAIELVPDLIVSDVMMPKKDGYQVVQELKTHSITEHIPIIILTAKASFDSMLVGLKHGADDYLSKPFKSTELSLRIGNQLSRQQKLIERYRHESNVEEAPQVHPFIAEIESKIAADFSIQLSVEELADLCALSRSQLHRKVTSLTGLSASALQTKIRMDRAILDLKTTDLNISEIAFRYGYSDPANFSRLFKKEFQKTPSEIRESA